MKRKIQLPEPLPAAVVVDLDGTLYDDTLGRETLIKSGWTEYFKLCDSFPFDEDVFRELSFFSMGGMRIFFISERPECLRRVTESGLVNFFDFEPWQLILKPEDCTLSGPQFKMDALQKIFENHEICMIFQNRISLRKLCKEAGFKRFFPETATNNFIYPLLTKVVLPEEYLGDDKGVKDFESEEIRSRVEICGREKFGYLWRFIRTFFRGKLNMKRPNRDPVTVLVDGKKYVFNRDLLSFHSTSELTRFNWNKVLDFPAGCGFRDDKPRKKHRMVLWQADCWYPPDGTYKVQTFAGKYTEAKFSSKNNQWSKPVALFTVPSELEEKLVYRPNADFNFFPEEGESGYTPEKLDSMNARRRNVMERLLYVSRRNNDKPFAFTDFSSDIYSEKGELLYKKFAVKVGERWMSKFSRISLVNLHSHCSRRSRRPWKTITVEVTNRFKEIFPDFYKKQE